MNFKNSLLPVCWASDVRIGKLKKVWLNGMPVVILRTSNGVRAYSDFCPHRGVPLSDGKLINNELQCLYYGWTFNIETGENNFVPVKNDKIKCSLAHIYVLEKYNLVWLASNGKTNFPILFDFEPTILLSGEINAQLPNALENFLEGSHTHFIHDGLIRQQKATRQLINAIFKPTETGFTVKYEAEPPKGLLTKLIPQRFRVLTPTAQFIYPNIAILEYFDQNQKLVSRFEGILGINEKKTTYFARIYLNFGVFNALIKPFAKLLFEKIILQDKQILELQEQNLPHFQQPFVSDETDFIGKQIFAWLYEPEKVVKEAKNLTLYW